MIILILIKVQYRVSYPNTEYIITICAWNWESQFETAANFKMTSVYRVYVAEYGYMYTFYDSFKTF